MTWEEHRWAVENAPSMTARQMADAFERRFGWRREPDAWRLYCLRRLINLKRREGDEPDRGPQRERAWILANAPGVPMPAVRALFREEFGWDIPPELVKGVLRGCGAPPAAPGRRRRRLYKGVRA